MADMDTSVRPGNNFFDYAVGSWVKDAKIPADRLCAGYDLDIQDKLDADVKTIVERATAEHAPTGEISQKIGDLYASYMDEAKLNELGAEPVKPLLEAVDGITDKAGLDKVLVTFNATASVSDPFPLSLTIDPNDPTRYVPVMSQGGISLGDREYYVGTDPQSIAVRTKFVDHVDRMLKLAGYPDSREQAEKVLAVETALAQVQLPTEELRDVEKSNNIMARADVEKIATGAPLHEMFDALKIPATTDFLVGSPEVLTKTAQVWASAPIEQWQAYLRYQVVAAYGGQMSAPFENELFDFFGKQLTGAKDRSPRQERGMSVVNGALGDAVGRLYVDEHFAGHTKEQALGLVDNLRTSFAARIDQATWMQPETAKEAQAKLAALVTKIGYPDTWDSYESLAIKPDDLVGNVRRLGVWSWDDQLSKLTKPVDRTQWAMTPQTNNAYYSARLNDIAFPAGILQSPYFDPAADPAVNYGAIGSTIGHEMSHAFDDQGRKSDGLGRAARLVGTGRCAAL